MMFLSQIQISALSLRECPFILGDQKGEIKSDGLRVNARDKHGRSLTSAIKKETKFLTTLFSGSFSCFSQDWHIWKPLRLLIWKRSEILQSKSLGLSVLIDKWKRCSNYLKPSYTGTWPAQAFQIQAPCSVHPNSSSTISLNARFHLFYKKIKRKLIVCPQWKCGSNPTK